MESRDIVGYVNTRFFDAYAGLPKHIQKKTVELFKKFTENPLLPGLNYEKLKDCSDNMRSLRVDQAYRAIVYTDKEKWTMAYVGKHEDAYNWAKRAGAKCDTGIRLSIGEIKEDTQDGYETEKRSVFEDIKDGEWKDLGIDKETRELARGVESESELYALKDAIAPEAFEILEFLLAGFTVDEIKNEYLLVQSQQPPQPMLQAVPIKEHMKEIEQLWDKPLQTWRLYLHPVQEKLAHMDATGPVSVSGHPGTGKTVLAIHRSVWLAKHVLTEREKILVTTFSKQLSSELSKYIGELCPAEAFQKMEIINIDSWVHRYMQNHGYPYRIVYDEDMMSVMDAVIDRNHPDYSFYVDEWNQIIIPNEIRSLEEYRKVSRVGRGKRLSREEREVHWPVFQKLYEGIEQRKIRPFEMAVLDAVHMAEKEPAVFRCAVIDEGQDLSNGIYRLIRVLCGDEKPNDIFVLSDTKQQIYNKRPVLSKAGIHVKGRSFKLRVSYRITKQTRDLANRLSGNPYADIDGDTAEKDIEISVREGEKPVIGTAADKAAEQQWLLHHLQNLFEQGANPEDICIVARTKSILEDYAAFLKSKGYGTCILGVDGDACEGKLLFSTMHRIKGLEFEYIFILSVNQGVLPLKQALEQASDEAEKKNVIKREKNLLYVAITRARKNVYISGYGERSEFLKEL